MSKKALLVMVFITLCGCNVNKTVENAEKSEEKPRIEQGLSTEGASIVDNSVDNRDITREQDDKTMDNATETVEESSGDVDDRTGEALKQAKEYYTYYAAQAKLHGKEASLIYSEKSFLECWEKEKDTSLSDLYEDTGWFDRGSYMSLKFMPKPCMFGANNDNVYTWLARCIKGFLLAKEKYSGDELWDHEDSLIPQYHCHTLYAGSKKLPWYIEPHRTETRFLVILAAKGNPEPEA